MPQTTAGKIDPKVRAPETYAAIAPPTAEELPLLEETVTDLFPDAKLSSDAASSGYPPDPMDDRPAIAVVMAKAQERATDVMGARSTMNSSPFQAGDNMRLVRISRDAMEKWVGRTDDGYKLILAWGNPVNGIYTPTFSIDRSDKLG